MASDIKPLCKNCGHSIIAHSEDLKKCLYRSSSKYSRSFMSCNCKKFEEDTPSKEND